MDKAITETLVNCRLNWGEKIPLRDGTQLSATLYLPRAQGSPAPCIVTMTPYTADSCHEPAVYFSSNGFPFVAVDVRGRGNSEGIFSPLRQEAQDGYDVVEWLAGQSYCNGQVAFWGGSYNGFAQWAAAKEFPPHLATMVPVAAPYIGVDFPMRRNIFFPFLLQWLHFTRGRTVQTHAFSDDAFWSALYRQWYESGESFLDLGQRLGAPPAPFLEWLSHPCLDEYWDGYNPSDFEYARLEMPILTITGSYDDNQLGALEHYKAHLRNTSPEGRAQHYLVMGPWDHAGTRVPKLAFGGLQFGDASLIDLPKLHLEWYAWTMQGGPRPKFLKKSVACYVMGADAWRYADTLAELTANTEEFFLDSRGEAHSELTVGWLASKPGRGPPDSYRLDPKAKDPEVDVEARMPADSLMGDDWQKALRGRSLVYDSATFSEDRELSGFVTLSAWISIDCPDTDLYVSLYEMTLDGHAIRLTTDAMRARYRTGPRSEVLIKNSEPALYEFNQFTFISHQIRCGHRLRLLIAPVGRLIEGKFTQRNFNGGGIVAKETVKESRAVTVSVFHDENRQSSIAIPWGPPTDGIRESEMHPTFSSNQSELS